MRRQTKPKPAPSAEELELRKKTGALIAARMRALGLNETTLAVRAGIARTVLHRLITGERRTGQQHALRLAPVLGLEIAELLSGAPAVGAGDSRPGPARLIVSRYLERKGEDLTRRQTRFLEGYRERLGDTLVTEESLDRLLEVVSSVWQQPGGGGGGAGPSSPPSQ